MSGQGRGWRGWEETIYEKEILHAENIKYNHGELTGKLDKFIQYEKKNVMVVLARFICTRYFQV